MLAGTPSASSVSMAPSQRARMSPSARRARRQISGARRAAWRMQSTRIVRHSRRLPRSPHLRRCRAESRSRSARKSSVLSGSAVPPVRSRMKRLPRRARPLSRVLPPPARPQWRNSHVVAAADRDSPAPGGGDCRAGPAGDWPARGLPQLDEEPSMRRALIVSQLGAMLLACSIVGGAMATEREPAAVVDLGTQAGAELVQATWRYSDARIVDISFRAPDAHGQPTGAPLATHDILPHAGSASFDDSQWPTIAPASLAERRGSGRLSFNWYRLTLTLPQ